MELHALTKENAPHCLLPPASSCPSGHVGSLVLGQSEGSVADETGSEGIARVGGGEGAGWVGGWIFDFRGSDD